MNFLTATTILLLAASASQHASTAANPTSVATDAAKIYEAFLNTWTGKEHHTINVSKSAEVSTPQDIQEYTECVKEDGSAHVIWTKGTPIADLRDTIGHLPYVHLVDPKEWHPDDPGNLISKGQSVESAVDAGFSAGLLTFSAVTFDDSHKTAAFTYSFVCGGLCGNGGAVIFKKTSKGWIQSKRSCGGWISQYRPNNSVRSFPSTPVA